MCSKTQTRKREPGEWFFLRNDHSEVAESNQEGCYSAFIEGFCWVPRDDGPDEFHMSFVKEDMTSPSRYKYYGVDRSVYEDAREVASEKGADIGGWFSQNIRDEYEYEHI